MSNNDKNSQFHVNIKQEPLPQESPQIVGPTRSRKSSSETQSSAKPTRRTTSNPRQPAPSPSPSRTPAANNSPSASTAAATAASTTAGAAQSAKRVFVPNLGVKRATKDIKVEPEKVEDKNRNRRPITPNLNAANRGGRGGRGRGRGENLIQSHSIFEAGPAESTKRFGGDRNASDSFSQVVGIASCSATSSGSTNLSAINIKKDPHSDNTEMKIEESLIVEDFKEEEETTYVTLKHEFKELNEIKSDLKDEKSVDLAERKVLNEIFVNNAPDEEKLILFQIPESLQLNDLGEGHIGKLRIYKSGRVKMCLDNEKYLDLSLSVSGSFLQDVAALELDETNVDNNKMTNLGHVRNKIVCLPSL